MAARRVTPSGNASIGPMGESMIERLVAEAIRRGADLLEVEYRDGFEDIIAARGGVGHNLRTAKALGITLPQSLLVRADQLLE